MGNSIFWLLLAVILVIAEAVTVDLICIWFAAGAAAGMLASLLGLPDVVQAAAALIVSIATLAAVRPIAKKHFNQERVPTNADRLIGKEASVLEDIDSLQSTGLVSIEGQEWSAKSEDDRKRIPAGSIVEVVAISGVKLVVTEKIPDGKGQESQELEQSPVSMSDQEK